MSSPVLIREESRQDIEAVQALLQDAFREHPYSDNTEHQLVAALRHTEAMSLALVAELDGEIVGFIAFSPVNIGGKEQCWLGLAPVAVAPEYQRQGVGSALINEGLVRIKQQLAAGCVVVGDPAYYQRFGFQSVPGMVYPGVPQTFVMGLCFSGTSPSGQVEYHPVFRQLD